MNLALARRSYANALLCASFAAVCFIFPIDLRATATTTAITWRACTPELLEAGWIAALGARLECGTMLAWLDADTPALGSLTVGLVRLRAGDPARREGSIFFNFGGPGGNPLDFLPGFGYLWSTRSLDHPLDGDKRRLTDRYDLIAVIPRGLRGGTRFTCRHPEASDGHDPTVDLADWNWDGFAKDAKAYAAGCAADPLHPHVGTLQHVRDMEQARLALHENVLNFVGISYGTWVGAFYASAYPDHAGRIVLDSAMNHAGTFEDQLADDPYERQSSFARTALRPALAAPALYGVGSDADEVMARFRNMPHRAHEAWASTIDTPEELVAALTMADWILADGKGTQAHLLARMKGHRFSRDSAVDNDIRRAAIRFAATAEQGLAFDSEAERLVDFSVYHAVVCGDTPWQKNLTSLRGMANNIGARYPASNGVPVTVGLTCLYWPTAPRSRPSLAGLAKAPPMLMVQAEFDPATPLTGAIRAFNASPNAYLVLARGMTGHGVFGSSATPCVERAVGRFLLEGELPRQRLSGCEFVPTPPSRHARGVETPLDEGVVRDELVRRLRTS
ncbi:alpha/beta hydrolase [Luteibacter sp. dw_328]|uniref:alpha/beta hydrolase n=1 Tax=Luteibacter sp. dw_328 TaxID=2719796 RepID=UPI001BD5B230